MSYLVYLNPYQSLCPFSNHLKWPLPYCLLWSCFHGMPTTSLCSLSCRRLPVHLLSVPSLQKLVLMLMPYNRGTVSRSVGHGPLKLESGIQCPLASASEACPPSSAIWRAWCIKRWGMVRFFQRPEGWGLVSVGSLRDLVGIQRRPAGCAFERQVFVALLYL